MTRQTESSLSSLATVASVISTRNDDDPLVVLNNDSATLSLFGGARNFLTLLAKGEQLRLGYQYFVGGLLVRSIRLLVTYRDGVRDVRASATRKGTLPEREAILKERANDVLKQLASLWGEESIATSPFYEIKPSDLYQRTRKLSSKGVLPPYTKGAFFESNFKTKVDKLIQTFLDDQRASTFRMRCFRNLYINMKNIFGGLPKIPDDLGGYPFKSWWFYKVVKNKKLKAVKERLVSDGEIKVEQPLLSLTDGMKTKKEVARG